jgi:hypothetical protein
LYILYYLIVRNNLAYCFNKFWLSLTYCQCLFCNDHSTNNCISKSDFPALIAGLLFSGLCRGRLDCWVADVSIAMLLSSSELVNKLVWSIPCWAIYMVSGGSGPRGIGGGGGRRGSVTEVSGGVRTWSNDGIPRARKLNPLVSVEIIWIFSNLDCFPY